ncbi:MAG: Gfo/Idh/MocA family oxidoreductase [Thermoflexales bacterium]
MRPIRLGVIGTGLIWSRVHQPQLANLQGVFEPVAFADVSAERRAALAGEYPQAVVLSDYRELLGRPDVAAVLVLTPIALNETVALDAIRAGKDVLLEKPLARSVAKGIEIIGAARQAGRRLFVTEQMGYRRSEEALITLLASGEIGDVIMWNRVQHRVLSTQPERQNYTSTPWRIQPDFPMGNMFDGGIHVVASLTRIFGTPASVCASGSKKFRPGYGDYDQLAMLFTYANGLHGTLGYSDCLHEAQNHFHVHGTQGVLSWTVDRIIIHKPDQPDRLIPLPAEVSYASMWQGIAEAWQSGRMPLYTAEHALRDVMVIEQIHQSLITGQRVPTLQSDMIAR